MLLMNKIYGFLIFFLFGCQTTEPPQKTNFTPGVAQSLLVKGQTTKADIVAQWGSPNIVTRNASGQTVWTYSKQSYDTKRKEGVGTLFLISGAQAVNQSATSSFDVVITFDSKDIVQDFSVTSSQF